MAISRNPVQVDRETKTLPLEFQHLDREPQDCKTLGSVSDHQCPVLRWARPNATILLPLPTLTLKLINESQTGQTIMSSDKLTMTRTGVLDIMDREPERWFVCIVQCV